MKKMKQNYQTPCVEMVEVKTEQGFAQTQGSTIEQIEGRNADQEW